MASKLPRPRSMSTSSMINRPKSRQSTTSIQSNTTQPAPPYYQTAQPAQHEEPLSALYHAAPELFSAQSSHQTTGQSQSYLADQSMHMNSVVPHDMPYEVEHNNGFPSRIEELIQAHNQQTDRSERQASEALTQYGDSQDNNTETGAKRKKGAATSAANDIELRRLFRENQGRDLHEVAQQVLENDKGPKSEKTKQIFGMLWLDAYCHRAKNGSVPRSRVFSSYATGCGTERIPPLNPASFGKLVRIIFPGIATRRLGIRGESKYHYVELALKYPESNPENPYGQRDPSTAVDGYGTRVTDGSRHHSLRPQVRTDNTAVFPSPRTLSAPKMSQGRLYLRAPFSNHLRSDPSKQVIVSRPLHIQATVSSIPDGATQLDLPSIVPYLPPGVDEDAVSSLTSVYRSHCFLAIDNFRYCKTDKLCDSYKSLIGLLTVPGQKLLAHPQIANWIRDCDWLKYQKMTPLLDQTLIVQIPQKAMLHIQHVNAQLCDWISQFFHNQPQHVLDAMLGPANMFVSLLERYLRVNRACRDVADVLDNGLVRGELWADYVSYVNPYQIVAQALTLDCDNPGITPPGATRVLHILMQELREILCPSAIGVSAGDNTIFEHKTQQTVFEAQAGYDPSMEIDASGVIHRIIDFLRSLPVKFPKVQATEMLNKLDVVGNAIQRTLSLSSAQSLPHWWHVKVFVDEISHWLAEVGGFQDYGADSMYPDDRNIDVDPDEEYGLDGANDRFETDRARPTSRRPTSSAVVPHPGNDNYTSMYVRPVANGNPPAHPPPKKNHAVDPRLRSIHQDVSVNEITGLEDDRGANAHDDSGIGMGVDDEFGMDGKYGGFVEGVHGSDPADVVVC